MQQNSSHPQINTTLNDIHNCQRHCDDNINAKTQCEVLGTAAATVKRKRTFTAAFKLKVIDSQYNNRAATPSVIVCVGHG